MQIENVTEVTETSADTAAADTTVENGTGTDVSVGLALGGFTVGRLLQGIRGTGYIGAAAATLVVGGAAYYGYKKYKQHKATKAS